jgi:isoleucyl-tRNA synthetase
MTEPTTRRYPEVAGQPDYVALEEATLEHWAEDGTFEASLAQREGAPEYVFYDGPPFANGLPHYGHLLTGFVKDAIPRYQTMRGKHVERRFGWDCHGLPAELEAERGLGVSGRGPITEFGIDRFNDYCRTSVMRYTGIWQRYVTRQGRWVDFAHDYKTMDLSFMESALWAFKQLYERGLVYEDYKVLPYCWECETPLSNAETRLDDAYRMRIDPAVTVLFDLLPLESPSSPDEAAAGAEPSELASVLRGPLRLMAWTTTPWTLPSNLALAVGPDIEYAVLERAGEHIVLSADRVEAYAPELEGATQMGAVLGSELVGRRYTPLFDYFAGTSNAFVVLGADFVETGEGTGVVHMAPGFGEDDQRACNQAGIEVIVAVDEQGRFDERVRDFAGMQVFEANPHITEALRARGLVVRSQAYEHSYPHCWRTDTPLIYRAMTSFFVKVTSVRDRMVELNHDRVRFVPEHVRDGAFGNWLKGARDWSISRNRFWGTPIPVWRSDDPSYPRTDVYGSLDELESDFGLRPTDLHRPAIDELTRPNPDDPTGRSTMRRVTDVLDCWFDSGSMPFAQLHYPFEHAERFEANFPADFICEYVGQTRAWFYNMHVLAAALFDRPAFSTCIAHGIVLGDDGRKLSKRLRNFPDPEKVLFGRELDDDPLAAQGQRGAGADALRWYLFASPVLRGLDVVVEATAMSEPVRQVMNPIWNSWYFLSLYGRTDGMVGELRTTQTGLLDRWLLARTRRLVEEATAALDDYDLPGATAAVSSYIEVLTNWYVRRSRERFWRPVGAQPGDGGTGPIPAGDAATSASASDKVDAYDTLHTALEVLCRVCAPLLPFLTESVWRGLTSGRSVHLTDWPDPGELGLPADDELVSAMDLVREIASAAHSIRKANGLRARLPLRRLTIASAEADRLGPFLDLLSEELNVKEVRTVSALDALASSRLSVRPATLGPRLGEATQQVIAAARRGDWATGPDGGVVVAGESLLEGEYEVRLVPLDEQSTRILSGGTSAVSLELTLDDSLEGEGLSRDVVRAVQQARRKAGLHVSDRIELLLVNSQKLAHRLEAWRDEPTALGVGPESPEAAHQDGDGRARWRREVAAQTLATSIEVRVDVSAEDELAALEASYTSSGWYAEQSKDTEVDGERVLVALRRADPDRPVPAVGERGLS